MSTLKDIAEYVGISISAASMALKDHRSISDETKRKVWEAQRILGYKMPLRPPSSLVEGKRPISDGLTTRDIVCLLVDRSFSNPTYATTFESLAKYATERHWRPIHLAASLDDLQAGRIPPILKNGGVDGIVVSGAYSALAHQHLRKLGVPIAVLGRYQLGVDPWMSCEPDVQHGVTLFLDRLSAFGHTRFGMVIESIGTKFTLHFRQQFQLAFQETDLQLMGIASPTPSPEHNVISIEELLSKGTTAILLGGRGTELYSTCERLGLRIPEDISIVAMRSESPPELSPAMTVIRMHSGSTLRIIEKLNQMIDSPEITPTRELFPMRLVPGSSIGICSKNR